MNLPRQVGALLVALCVLTKGMHATTRVQAPNVMVLAHNIVRLTAHTVGQTSSIALVFMFHSFYCNPMITQNRSPRKLGFPPNPAGAWLLVADLHVSARAKQTDSVSVLLG